MLEQALESLPAAYRPTPTIRARNRFWCAAIPPGPPTRSPTRAGQAGVGFSFGYPVDARVRDAVETLNTGDSWYPAIDSDGGIRDGAWVAEATELVDMSTWPAGTRLILRKERPHPGAQLRFTDSDGLRVTAFITDTAPGVVPGQLAGLELRHRQHARVEDRIREAKATGLRNLPCHRSDANAAWLEIILAATDLVAWTKLIGFTEPAGSGHAARSTPSATGSCTSPPASPAAPAKSGYASTPPGDGPPRSPKDGNDFGPPSPDTQLTVHPTRGPTGPGKPAPERHRPTCHTHGTISPTSRPARHYIRPEQVARKIEANLRLCSPKSSTGT